MSKKLSFTVVLEANERESPTIIAEQIRALVSANAFRSKSVDVKVGRVHAENQDVLEFQEKFQVPMRRTPGFLVEEAQDFRTRFMAEELAEFELACEERDLPGALDALLDLVYVVHGTALMMGLPWQEGWDEVQRANMQKVRAQSAEESKRGTQLDVVKPAGWTAPDHAPAIERARVRGILSMEDAPRTALPIKGGLPNPGFWPNDHMPVKP